MLGRIVRALRQQKGLSQADVADEVGISQPAVSQIELSRRTPTPKVRRALDRALALGPQHEQEEDPVYVLAVLTPSGMLEVMFTDDGRIGMYERRATAEVAATQLLRGISKLPVYAVPSWMTHLALAAVQRYGSEDAADRLFFVDGLSDPRKVGFAVAQHTLSVLAGVEDRDAQQEEARRLAEGIKRPRRRKPVRKKTPKSL